MQKEAQESVSAKNNDGPDSQGTSQQDKISVSSASRKKADRMSVTTDGRESNFSDFVTVGYVSSFFILD